MRHPLMSVINCRAMSCRTSTAGMLGPLAIFVRTIHKAARSAPYRSIIERRHFQPKINPSPVLGRCFNRPPVHRKSPLSIAGQIILRSPHESTCLAPGRQLQSASVASASATRLHRARKPLGAQPRGLLVSGHHPISRRSSHPHDNAHATSPQGRTLKSTRRLISFNCAPRC